jgi:hypothetical protein
MVSSTSKPSSQQLLCLGNVGCNMSTARCGIIIFVALSCVSPSVSAQSIDVTRFFAGAALGLGVHESAHLIADEAFGANPGVRKVSAGFIPFFAITHEPVTPTKEFIISSGGFWAQHIGSEIILAKHPQLRDEHAPVLKGWFAFNLVTSVIYAGAAFVRHGPAERDTRGIALSADVGEPWVGVTVLAPAVLDAARYYRPDSRTLRWASRAAKVGGTLLIFKAARKDQPAVR